MPKQAKAAFIERNKEIEYSKNRTPEEEKQLGGKWANDAHGPKNSGNPWKTPFSNKLNNAQRKARLAKKKIEGSGEVPRKHELKAGILNLKSNGTIELPPIPEYGIKREVMDDEQDLSKIALDRTLRVTTVASKSDAENSGIQHNAHASEPKGESELMEVARSNINLASAIRELGSAIKFHARYRQKSYSY